MADQGIGLLLSTLDLEAELQKRVVKLYEEGHYEESAANAFKVLETQMRTIANTQQDGVDLVATLFNPAGGKIADVNARPSEREGVNQLFRGIMMTFRNPFAHRWIDPTAQESFELIVLVNNLMRIVKRMAFDRSANQTPRHFQRATAYGSPLLLDLDRDGSHEVMLFPASIDGRGAFSAYSVFEGKTSSLDVVHPSAGAWGFLADAFAIDLDGDAVEEIVVFFEGVTTGSSVVVYRQTETGWAFVDVEKTGDDHEDSFLPALLDAIVEDFDGDGNAEVVSAPWGSVPKDLVPSDQPYSGDDYVSGRARYVYKLYPEADKFQLVKRDLLYIGGR